MINDSPGLLLVVEKLPWANTVEMTKGVEEAIRSLEPGLPGVQFDTTIFQQANFITASIHNLTQALVLGFVLVIVILALFLFEWRVALISILTIPLSLMTTLLVLYWRGETINTMTLAGLVIALGAVVDDAIIDVENIVRRLRQHRLSGGEGSTASVILNASLEVRGPIVYATLIIVAAAVPIFLLQGLTGAFFRPLALSYTLAIVASLARRAHRDASLGVDLAWPIQDRAAYVARGGSPAARLHRSTVPHRRQASAGVRDLSAGHRHRHRTDTAARPVVVPRLQGTGLLDPLGDASLGRPPRRCSGPLSRSARNFAQIPGVRNFGAHIGQAFLGEEVAGVNLGENWVSIDPSVDYDSTLDKIEDVNDAYAGLFRETQTYLDERIEEVISGGKEPIVVRVYRSELVSATREGGRDREDHGHDRGRPRSAHRYLDRCPTTSGRSESCQG